MNRQRRHADRKALMRQRRIAEGRCTACGEKLPDGYPKKMCEPCLDAHRLYNANHYARVSGAKQKDRPGIQSPSDRTPGCAVCGLRGEHGCLRGNASDRKAWL